MKRKQYLLLLGSGKQKEKREKLAALRAVSANESLVVVATGKYIGGGFDKPRLDTILLATKTEFLVESEALASLEAPQEQASVE